MKQKWCILSFNWNDVNAIEQFVLLLLLSFFSHLTNLFTDFGTFRATWANHFLVNWILTQAMAKRSKNKNCPLEKRKNARDKRSYHRMIVLLFFHSMYIRTVRMVCETSCVSINLILTGRWTTQQQWIQRPRWLRRKEFQCNQMHHKFRST